jgi:hypothetical protein
VRTGIRQWQDEYSCSFPGRRHSKTRAILARLKGRL